MNRKTIAIDTADPVLRRMLEEQIRVLPDVVLAAGEDAAGKSADIALVPERDFSAPLRLGEFLDRISYLLSGRARHAAGKEKDLSFGPFLLRGEAGTLSDKDHPDISIRLTDKEIFLLRDLILAPGHAVEKTALLRDVWGYADDAETHTLETHLYRLRQKLEGEGAAIFIEVQDGVVRLRWAEDR